MATQKMNFSFDGRWDPLAARLSWLRSAYLAAFTSLGYRYILDRVEFDEFRQQLSHPEQTTLPETTVFLEAVATPAILLVLEPEPFADSLLVSFGRHKGLLPGLRHEPDFFRRANEAMNAAARDGRIDVQFNGKLIPWPTAPVFGLDLSQ